MFSLSGPVVRKKLYHGLDVLNNRRLITTATALPMSLIKKTFHFYFLEAG